MLTIKTFSKRNLHRCEDATGFNHKLSDWSLSDWMVALAGEVGEVANIVKKLNRYRDGVGLIISKESEQELKKMLEDELADIYCYLDLFAQAANIDLSEAIESKFQAVSKKIGYIECTG